MIEPLAAIVPDNRSRRGVNAGRPIITKLTVKTSVTKDW